MSGSPAKADSSAAGFSMRQGSCRPIRGHAIGFDHAASDGIDGARIVSVCLPKHPVGWRIGGNDSVGLDVLADFGVHFAAGVAP